MRRLRNPRRLGPRSLSSAAVFAARSENLFGARHRLPTSATTAMCGHYREDVRTRDEGDRNPPRVRAVPNALSRASSSGPPSSPSCQPPTCVADRRGEARRPREPLLPPARPREGPFGLSPHGGNWSGRFLAVSSVPVSPESVSPGANGCATRVETGQDPASWSAPRRDALVRGTEVPFTAAGSKLDAWSRPSLHATPPTLPPDDSAFGTGRCD